MVPKNNRHERFYQCVNKKSRDFFPKSRALNAKKLDFSHNFRNACAQKISRQVEGRQIFLMQSFAK